jgi:O-antigen/teichoic acid export membrane protein
MGVGERASGGGKLSTLNIFVRNSFYLFVSQLGSSVLSVVLGVYIARQLGDIGYGQYSLALAFAAIFVMFADIGYQTLFFREVSLDTAQAERYLSNVTGIRVLMTVLVFFLMVLIANLLQYPQELLVLIYLFGAYTLLSSLYGIYLVTFRSFQQMKYEAAVIFVDGVSKVVLGIAVLQLGLGLVELGLVFVASALLSLVLSIVICHRHFVRPRIAIDMEFMRSTLWMALPFSVLPVLSMIYVRVDTLLLEAMKGDAVVGWYNAAYSIVLSVKFIPTLLLAALFPAAQQMSKQSRDRFCDYYDKAVKYLMALAIPIAIGLTLLAQPIILLIFGQEFEGAVAAFRILAWDILLFFIYLAIGNALLNIGREKSVAVASLMTVIINIALNLVLIPLISLIGAAIVTVISEAVLLAAYLYIYAQELRPVALLRHSVKPILASLPLIPICLFFANSLLIALPLSMLVYFVVFIAIGGMDVDEFTLLKLYLHRAYKRFKSS